MAKVRPGNFVFLEPIDAALFSACQQAERAALGEPLLAIIGARSAAERLARLLFKRHIAHRKEDPVPDIAALIGQLRDRAILQPEIARVMHVIRTDGNKAAHEQVGDTARARTDGSGRPNRAQWERRHRACAD